MIEAWNSPRNADAKPWPSPNTHTSLPKIHYWRTVIVIIILILTTVESHSIIDNDYYYGYHCKNGIDGNHSRQK